MAERPMGPKRPGEASGSTQHTAVQDKPQAAGNPRGQAPATEGAPSRESLADRRTSLAQEAVGQNLTKTDIEMLRDVELKVTVELGRTKMTIGEITGLTAGSIVTLAKAAGEPADLRINDQLFASGEVIVMDGYFAVKITKLLSKEERLKNFA